MVLSRLLAAAGAPIGHTVPAFLAFQITDLTGTQSWAIFNASTVFALSSDFSTTSPGIKGGAAGATLAVRTADDTADAPLSAKTLTLSTRTGTPATFACFDSGGKLVESAVACA